METEIEMVVTRSVDKQVKLRVLVIATAEHGFYDTAVRSTHLIPTVVCLFRLSLGYVHY